MDQVEQLIDVQAPMASVQQVDELYDGHSVRGTVYTPKSVSTNEAGAPVLIFYHGGGMVIGSALASDRLCRCSELAIMHHVVTFTDACFDVLLCDTYLEQTVGRYVGLHRLHCGLSAGT